MQYETEIKFFFDFRDTVIHIFSVFARLNAGLSCLVSGSSLNDYQIMTIIFIYL